MHYYFSEANDYNLWLLIVFKRKSSHIEAVEKESQSTSLQLVETNRNLTNYFFKEHIDSTSQYFPDLHV